ncbi:MAG: hypothetical protein AUG51_05810 [Acidobacteria bacterium 13_1_20CM_3_53_8]|nr:MAG: hypothetical protein AUG51_05810 [Acidobacteria bacterium 13_1_20CM_3_53_8]
MDTGKSSIGLDGNIAAALGYPIGIIAIICLIIEKENRFVKFHALQSILLHVAFVVVAIALSVLGIVVGIAGAAASSAGGGGAIGGLFGMLIGLVWLVFVLLYLGALIYAAVKAYGGNKLN